MTESKSVALPLGYIPMWTPTAGLEPATLWLTVRCYYLLSYVGLILMNSVEFESIKSIIIFKKECENKISLKLSRFSILKKLARREGIEPSPRVLETLVLPLNYLRINKVRKIGDLNPSMTYSATYNISNVTSSSTWVIFRKFSKKYK